ncbi:MAG: ABC transporter permease [Saprospiraceae bacterium]|nr:ABC transporter permease [Saprospiraceae bacterium]
MIKNYFKIAWRNLLKQKGLSFINVFGLSIGLACFSLFLLYAVNEFSFDRFHQNRNNVFRVVRWNKAIGNRPEGGDSYMPIPLGPAMKNDLPGVVNFVRLREGWGESFVKVNNSTIPLDVMFVDPQFFDVFSFKILMGDKHTALKDLRSIVITEDIAKKLFGETNVVGRVVEIKGDKTFEPFTITAVAENPPANSTISFKILANWAFMESNTETGKRNSTRWTASGYQTYVQLQAGSGLPNDAATLAAFRKKYYPNEAEELKKRAMWSGSESPISYRLQSISDMHTNRTIEGGLMPPISPKNIWILLAIAAGVLIIACINFTTLAIGRSASRAKEIGIRKVIGSDKRQLVAQFLIEALVLSGISAVIGFILAQLLLPYFNTLSGRELVFSYQQYPEMAWMMAGLVVLVGLLAGTYPALILSNFKPLEVLKSKVRVAGANLFTKSLVTVQFILSIGLIISTVVILQQIHFMQNQNPGFNKENIVMVNAESIDAKRIFPLFKQQMLAQPSVKAVAGTDIGLGAGSGWSVMDFEYEGKSKSVYEYSIDADYIPLMSMEMKAGRNFDAKIASDTITSVIVNEALVKDFGWTIENAVGRALKGYDEKFSPIVIGVVKDFNFRPLRESLKPQLFHQFPGSAPFKYFVKIEAGNPSATLAAMQKTWTSLEPNLPFQYDFLDESLNQFYKAESRLGNIIGWAGSISIFLACLGLFGLAALSTVNRTKEIGIRKVLGASASHITTLLSKDFLKLVLIAIAIASPIAWWLMHKWLQDFAFRISVEWWVFVFVGFIALLIALFTVSFQAIKSALANPVKSLRME